jgi:hypothetical protein
LAVVTDEPNQLFARATAARAEVLMGLHDTDYGSRDFAVRDPEGNRWSFGTYREEPRKNPPRKNPPGKPAGLNPPGKPAGLNPPGKPAGLNPPGDRRGTPSA